MEHPALSSILLVECLSAKLDFGDATFDVTRVGGEVTIARDPKNKVVIRQKSGLYGSESSIEGGVVLDEEKTGDAGYEKYFSVHWDEVSLPELTLSTAPAKVERRYEKGQSIELGLEDVSSQGYCFQVDLARRTVELGLRVEEVPITFVERELGSSKMSRAIVLEALWRVTRWGLRYRIDQLTGQQRRRRRAMARSAGAPG